MSEHERCYEISWCKRCGRPMEEIVELDLNDCDGLRGVTHARYIQAKADNDRLMQPIIDAVWMHLTHPAE